MLKDAQPTASNISCEGAQMSSGIPSASGARLSGDDYQHVLTWLHALELLLVDGGVSRIEFEADQAGNVDDLVVHRVNGTALYHQIKFVVAQSEPLTHKWFTTPPKRGKRSPLERFWESYLRLTTSDGKRPEMALHTNRLPAVDDPLLKHVSGTDCKLVPRLFGQKRGSAAGKIRREWAEHLGVEEDELAALLSHLSIRSGRAGLDDLERQCSWAMRAVGYRPDTAALLSAVGGLRKLIRTGVRELDANRMRRVGEELNLVSGEPRATLLIQMLAPDPWPETATASVDWVDLMEGGEPGSRRQLKDPSNWNERLKPELTLAVEKLKKHRLSEVDVQGTMRLSTGTLVGTMLSEVAGFKLAILGREGRWASDGCRERIDVIREWVEIGQGNDLAVVVAVSQQIAGDVAEFVRHKRIPIGDLVVYSPIGGSSRYSIKSPAAGLGLAVSISNAIREDTGALQEQLHLFQAGPLALAIMIGHLWNRMPATQLYDDLGPGAGYAPTFLI